MSYEFSLCLTDPISPLSILLTVIVHLKEGETYKNNFRSVPSDCSRNEQYQNYDGLSRISCSKYEQYINL